MTLLGETRRLVLPPSSNPPLDVDRSWASLLAGGGAVGIVGAVAPAVEEAVARFSDSVVNDPDDGVRLSGLVLAAECVTRGVTLAERNPEAAVVVLPGGDVPAISRRWLLIDERFGGGGLGDRIGRAADLVLGRVASRFGVVPERLRGHASDVGFLTVPDDFRAEADTSRLSVGLSSTAPPDYLAAAASVAGLVIGRDGWSFGRPRGFASQKVVFRVSSGNRPFIVKMTQHPRFNARLEAEAMAVERWAAERDRAFIVPEPLFSTEQGGLRMIGQTLLGGRPFRMVADSDPADRFVEAGFRAILELGARSAEPTTGVERSGALQRLRDDFLAIYDTPATIVEQLDGAVERLTRLEFPSVFMHGDFAAWNLLAEPDGQVGVLDWENADHRGVPLWDLFIYTRTVGKFIADTSGTRYTRSVFHRQFFEDTRLRTALERQVGEYCRLVDVPFAAIDDLFTLCWVQQAVREAATNPSPGWDTVQSARFLSVALEKRLGLHRIP